jgi:hypothetical protein
MYGVCDIERTYRVLVGKPEGRPRYRWEDNSKLDLKVWAGRAWIRLIWLRIWISAMFL